MKSFHLLSPLVVILTLANIGCGKGSSSFSLLSTSDSFKQTTGTVNNKVDILWVIDNSGSMESSQSNVSNNLNSFLADFVTKNLDFKMAVTTTDAYRVLFTGNHTCSKFRDGLLNGSCSNTAYTVHSGVFVMLPDTLNLASVFANNSRLTDSTHNIYGSGDERAFQSIKATLDEPLNSSFLRQDSFLSIIIVSDEDDFSNDTSSLHEDYNYSGLHTVQSYVDYLDTVTLSSPTSRRYNVNAMAIFDEPCRLSLNGTFSGRKIGLRYGELVDDVNAAFPNVESQGLKTSLCGNFANDLKNIANGILTLSSKFQLERIPKPETITVAVNGSSVPNRDTNPANDGGWYYEAGTNSIYFTGSSYIPAAGASINVHYDPAAYGQ